MDLFCTLDVTSGRKYPVVSFSSVFSHYTFILSLVLLRKRCKLDQANENKEEETCFKHVTGILTNTKYYLNVKQASM